MHWRLGPLECCIVCCLVVPKSWFEPVVVVSSANRCVDRVNIIWLSLFIHFPKLGFGSNMRVVNWVRRVKPWVDVPILFRMMNEAPYLPLEQPVIVVSFVVAIEKLLLTVSKLSHVILSCVWCEELITFCPSLWPEHNIVLIAIVDETVLPVDNGLRYSWRSTWVKYWGLCECSWL